MLCAPVASNRPVSQVWAKHWQKETKLSHKMQVTLFVLIAYDLHSAICLSILLLILRLPGCTLGLM